MFDGAGRAELADRERAELAVLESYLPAAMGDDELPRSSTERSPRRGPTAQSGPQAMGAVMKVRPPAGRRRGRRRPGRRRGAPASSASERSVAA